MGDAAAGVICHGERRGDPWPGPRRRGDVAATPSRTSDSEVGCVPRRLPHTCGVRRSVTRRLLRWWQRSRLPRRARNLHDAATAMVEFDGGGVPARSTTCWHCPESVATRPVRVRVFAFERDDGDSRRTSPRARPVPSGERLTPAAGAGGRRPMGAVGEGWAWNQVLIDLGASVVPPTPACVDCRSRGRARGISVAAPARSGDRLRPRQHRAGTVRRQ